MARRESKVAVLTDSECCLPAEVIEKYNIQIIPIGVNIDGQPYRDDLDLTAGEFWQRLPEIGHCTTSTPAAGEFMEKFRQIGKETKEIACVLLAGFMSGTYHSALEARDMLKEENSDLNIGIVDSRTSLGAVGFIALEAARESEEGQNLEAVVRIMKDMTDRVHWVNGLASTRVVSRFGRVPRSVADNKLSFIKQVIGQLDGTARIQDLGRMKTKQQGFERMLALMEETAVDGKPLHLNVHYADNREDGERFLDLVTNKFECGEAYLTQYPPSIACSAGPSTGASFFC